MSGSENPDGCCTAAGCPNRATAMTVYCYRHLGNVGQPPPRAGFATHTVDLMLHDLVIRKAVGTAKYGVAHQHDNGRDHLQDAYEEALDLAVYLRAEIERRKAGR